MRKLICTMLMTLLMQSSVVNAQESVADRVNTIEAQLLLLRKQYELRQEQMKGLDQDLLSLPRVLSVYGLDNKLNVKLVLASGTISTYGEGDVIRGLLKVLVITPKEVLITFGKGKTVKTIGLDFVTGAMQSGGVPGQSGGQQQGGVIVPALFPQADLLSPLPSVNAGNMPMLRAMSPAPLASAPR